VEPALLAICTSSDDTASRLRAGEALGAILAKGTADGLSMVPLSQAIQVDRTIRLLQDELLGGPLPTDHRPGRLGTRRWRPGSLDSATPGG